MFEPTRDSMRRARRGVAAFAFAALAATAMLLISENAYWRASTALDQLGAMGQARTSLQDLHRLVLDAETGQRGYLLTGRSQYLEPFRGAQQQVQATLVELRGYFAAQPDKAAPMNELDTLVQAKMSELDTTLRLYDEGREESWRAVLASDIGREQMDSFRAVSRALLADETQRVAAERQGVYDVLLLSRFGTAALAVLGLLAFFLYIRQTRALDAQREALRHATLAERDRLEAEVARRTAQLRELAQHLQTAREDERSRLARELHDELGALLTAAKLDAARLRSRIANTGPEALDRLAHLGAMLDSGIALKRRIIEDLRPSTLANLGLLPALDILAREHAAANAVPVHTDFVDAALGPAAELTVYRLVQEALTNASKYAHPSSIDVRLAAADARVHVHVEDDGSGFDPASVRASAHGLAGMRYRVEALGGQLIIDSAPGHGTRIHAVLPAPAPG